MTLTLHPHSTAADLLRLLAAWLAAIVLVQGIGAARALGQGPLHRHLVAAANHHHHDDAERHHHSAEAGMVTLAAAEPALDEAAFALVAALALMALAVVRALPDARRRHVWRAASAWAWLPTLTAPPRRPPRRA